MLHLPRKKRTTRSVLTPPCLATILSQMPRLSHFGMFAFKEKTRGHRQSAAPATEKKDHAFGFDPSMFGYDPLSNATPVTFWHVRVQGKNKRISSKVLHLPRKKEHAFGFDPSMFGYDPLHDVARSVSTLGARSVSTPAPFFKARTYFMGYLFQWLCCRWT